jgi:UDP-glucose 4-epimerase
MNCISKPVLVTGGCGFIGSHLVPQLVERGYDIVVIDKDTSGSRSNFTSAETLDRCVVYKCDIKDATQLTSIFKKHMPERVVHLASLISVADSKKNSKDYFDVSVNGTFNVINNSIEVGVKKFIYANSAATYGNPTEVPTLEQSLVQPLNPYSTFKYLGEQLALHYGRINLLPVISVRLFHQYGEGASALFGLFVKQIKSKQKLTISGDGTQRRDFAYVGDTANAICELLESDFADEIFNIGSGGTNSIIELAEAMGGEWEFIKRDSDEPDLMWADISKLRRMLPSAVPSSPFNETVKEVMKKLL